MKKKNYLDYIPVHNKEFQWDVKEDIVTVHVQHRGFYASLAQKIFHTPKISHIDLDRYASFVWQRIDGQKNVYQIGQEVAKEFGKECEPLYERLSTFVEILKQNKYITFVKEK